MVDDHIAAVLRRLDSGGGYAIVAGMLTLVLLRHAKSSWDTPSLADFDRPLAKRGQKAAPRMGAELAELVRRLTTLRAQVAARADGGIG